MKDVYGPAIRRERKRRGWSIRQLAERLAEVGAETIATANKVSKIESRALPLSIEEWLYFAAALDVPPAVLLSPYSIDLGQRAENLPGTGGRRGTRPVSEVAIGELGAALPLLVRRWLEGRTPPPFPLAEATSEDWWTAVNRERGNEARFLAVFNGVLALERIAELLEENGDSLSEEELDEAMANQTRLVSQIHELGEALRRDGIYAPRLDPADVAIAVSVRFDPERPVTEIGRALSASDARNELRRADERMARAREELTAAEAEQQKLLMRVDTTRLGSRP